MAVLAHCWPRGALCPRTQAFDDARAAVAAARGQPRGAATVLAMPGEGMPRRPTKWELAHGRAFATRAAARVAGGLPLPPGLNSGYALLPRPSHRSSPRPKPSRPTAPTPSPPSPSRELPRSLLPFAPSGRLDATFSAGPPRREARAGREADILSALETAGRPVFERESSLRRDWSSRRGKVIADGRRTAYCGHGMWVLLGRDVPVCPVEADAIGQAARGLLWMSGTMRLTDMLEALRRRGGAAARMDTPVFLAAILRRCGDIVLDERAGLARLRDRVPPPGPKRPAAGT